MARPKGSRNRPKRQLLALLQEQYPNYHPIVELAKIANDPKQDDSVRFQANREIAPYVTPKLAATHNTEEVGKSLEDWLSEIDGDETED